MLDGVFRSLINIIYPAQCLACKNPVAQEIIVCQDCLNKIEKNVPPFCPRCGRNLKSNRCLHCKKINFYFDRAFSACRYTKVSAELIQLFKYKGKTRLLTVLSEILSNFIKELCLPIGEFNVVIPVPLHRTRLREREFNQSELLSLGIAKEFAIKHSSKNLVRRLNNQAQAKLTADLRFANIQGAFAVRNKEEFNQKNVLLIDDVLTTGATCSEASRTLKEAGAKNVSVLTFAIT